MTIFNSLLVPFSPEERTDGTGFDPFDRCNINGCKRSDLSAPGCLKETLRLSVPPLLAV
jgi:hypothetical protein